MTILDLIPFGIHTFDGVCWREQWLVVLTALQGPANQSPLHTPVPVQFLLVSSFFLGSHFLSATFMILSSFTVPQNTFRVWIPGPHFDEHYFKRVEIGNLSLRTSFSAILMSLVENLKTLTSLHWLAYHKYSHAGALHSRTNAGNFDFIQYLSG